VHSEMLAHIMRTSFVLCRWTKCPQFKVHLLCISVTSCDLSWLRRDKPCGSAPPDPPGAD